MIQRIERKNMDPANQNQNSDDNEAKKPSFTDMVARAKWDAWAKLEGTTLDEAKQQYIDLIESLR